MLALLVFQSGYIDYCLVLALGIYSIALMSLSSESKIVILEGKRKRIMASQSVVK